MFLKIENVSMMKKKKLKTGNKEKKNLIKRIKVLSFKFNFNLVINVLIRICILTKDFLLHYSKLKFLTSLRNV